MRRGLRLSDPEITVAVAACIGNPNAVLKRKFGDDVKVPGMRIPLACEFLRNLGWAGFEPDRHVMDLFSRWFPEDETLKQRTKHIGELVGRKDRETTGFVYACLLGERFTPAGMSVTQADQIVWLYGSLTSKSKR